MHVKAVLIYHLYSYWFRSLTKERFYFEITLRFFRLDLPIVNLKSIRKLVYKY